MASQLDLDQGGSFRQTYRVYLGPSVGWQEIADFWRLDVLAGGTTTVARGTSLILVNFNGAVTLQLPSFKASSAGPQAIPRQWAIVPVTICEVGGFAQAHNILILPAPGELISGLAQISIKTNYGSFTIRPNLDLGGGTIIQ